MKEDEAILLDVPVFKQTKNNTCVPACIRMITEYLNKLVLTEPTGPLDEDRIARIVQTYGSGTHLMNTALLNNESEIVHASPSLEFAPEFEFHELRDIEKELEKKLPVAVWIRVVRDESDYRHAVVVKGMNKATKEIAYNDPTYGTDERITEMNFMEVWEPMGTKMLKVKIGRVSRPTLAEYLKEPEKVA